MTELRLSLSLGALQAIAEGGELVFEVQEEGLRLILACDDQAINAFREHINRSLLALLPAPPSLN